MFKKPHGRMSLPESEQKVLELWKREDVFKKTLEQREGAPDYVFYEGPPTANGLPHIGHVLPRAIKDLFPRYKSMAGYRVERKAGWDTHGLPVELEVERELGISGKPDIEKYGVKEFVARCKVSVRKYMKEWETLTDRIGFWVDLENAYYTYNPDYIESVWWAIKQLWDQGLIYKGHKVVPYCTRCGTSLSSHEVAQGYEDTEDPSLFVRFLTTDDEGLSLLVWTTTAWTLPSNTAVAVANDEDYVVAELDGHRYILAAALVEKVLGAEASIVKTMKGEELVGLEYRPPFGFFDTAENRNEGAFRVYAADFVSLEDGTGLVHMAPAFGEDDMRTGQKHSLPLFQPVDSEGRFVEPVDRWPGRFVKETDQDIIEELRELGLLYHAGTITHTYPFCWRCDTPLLYYARGSWFIEMTRIKDRVIACNKTINWMPSHLRDGRFGDFLENMVDWCLSRERYWGTPLPVWVCTDCGRFHCVGSFDEVRKLSAEPLGEFDPHKPLIDDIVLKCPECGGAMHRTPEVIDCWFDSGAMPFAQFHYPFENRDLFARQFPADYICEAIDQTRGWFYSLLAISAGVFGEAPYKNCLVTGHGLDENGQKMSKHKNNVVDPWEAIDKYGADVLRWFLYASSPPWYPKRFSWGAFDDIRSQVFDTVWNTYVFFTTYAEIDGYKPKGLPATLDVMDRWVLSRLNSLVRDVRSGLDNYDVTGTARKIAGFIDELSNWYVRRNRRRYWKSQHDHDKEAAYATLYACISTLSKLMAPYTPFLSETLYQGLDRAANSEVVPSVHLVDYPSADESMIDLELEKQMENVRQFVTLCRSARNSAAVRTRQPLKQVFLWGAGADDLGGFESIITEEINVQQIVLVDGGADYLSYRLAPRFDLLGPKYGKDVAKLADAVRSADALPAAAALLAQKPYPFVAGDRVFTLLPEEVEVRSVSREGFVSIETEGRGVSLDLTITPELRREGLAREVVNRVQKMRKDAGFKVEDLINARYEGSEEMVSAIEEHLEYIKRETLSVSFEAGRAENEFEQDYKVDDHELHLEVKRAKTQQA